jgi:hypothetical protein
MYLAHCEEHHDGVHPPALDQPLKHSRHLEGCLRVHQSHTGVAMHRGAVADPAAGGQPSKHALGAI